MSELQLKRIRCTCCGAEFENVQPGQTVFVCTRLGCGATFSLRQGEDFARVDKEKAERISLHRAALKDALDNFQIEQIKQYASVIIGMIPDDYRAQIAQYLYILKSPLSDSRPLRDYLQKLPSATRSEYIEMFQYILKYGKYNEIRALERTIPHYTDGEICDRLHEIVNTRYRELEREIQDTSKIRRDVFICHSSQNIDAAERVYNELINEGWKVWISNHNLDPHTLYYWDDIYDAIERCDIFLVLCTWESMMSDDVRKEIVKARELNKKRLELKLDEKPHTELFKDFFDGVTWIDAYSGLENALPALKKLVVTLRYPTPTAPAENPNERKALYSRFVSALSARMSAIPASPPKPEKPAPKPQLLHNPVISDDVEKTREYREPAPAVERPTIASALTAQYNPNRQGSCVYLNGYLYYVSKGLLRRMRPNGEDNEIYARSVGQSLYAAKHTVYMLVHGLLSTSIFRISDELYPSRKNKSLRMQIGGAVGQIRVMDDLLYYNTPKSLFTYDLDAGTSLAINNDSGIETLYATHGGLFYFKKGGLFGNAAIKYVPGTGACSARNPLYEGAMKVGDVSYFNQTLYIAESYGSMISLITMGSNGKIDAESPFKANLPQQGRVRSIIIARGTLFVLMQSSGGFTLCRYDLNTRKLIFSYVLPEYKDGLTVIGEDIYYNTIKQMTMRATNISGRLKLERLP